MSGVPAIQSLIATFPQREQEDQLRQAQAQAEQERNLQNALAIRENIAGQNALRQLYANRNSINPQTGLPNPNALGSVFQASPQMGLAALSAIDKLQDTQSRTALTNLKTHEELNNIFREEIADPTVLYDQQLQAKGIPADQRQTMIEQYRRQRVEQTQAQFGLTNNTAQAYNNVPYDGTWEARSELQQKRQQETEKGWVHEIDYGKNPPVGYWVNNHLNITTDESRTAPYKPTGVEKPSGKPEPIQIDTYKDDKGKTQTTSFTRDAFGRPIDVNTGAPYQIKGIVSAVPKAAESNRPLPAPLSATITNQDGSTKQGSVYRYPDGRIVDADTNAILDPNKVAIAKSEPLVGEGLDIPATQYLLTGQLPALGYGASDRTRIINRAGQMASDFGLSPAQVMGMRAAEKSDVAAALNLGKLRANVSNFEQTAQRESELTLALAENGIGAESVQNRLKDIESDPNAPPELKSLIGVKGSPGVAQTGVPVFNRWVQAGRTNIAGDPNVTAFNAALTSFKNEYARIMSAPGATGGMTSDTARAEADSLVNKAQTLEGLRGAIGTMQIGMKNRINSINNEFDATRSRIENLEKPTSKANSTSNSASIPPKASTSTSAKPPSNNVNELKNLPAGKQAVFGGVLYGRAKDGTLYKADENGAFKPVGAQ